MAGPIKHPPRYAKFDERLNKERDYYLKVRDSFDPASGAWQTAHLIFLAVDEVRNFWHMITRTEPMTGLKPFFDADKDHRSFEANMKASTNREGQS